MDVNHPVAIKMLGMGCTNHTRALLAFQTYIELCEAYVMRNVDYHFNSKLDMIYISSKAATGKRHIYIPVNVSDSISLSVISQWQDELIGDDPNSQLFAALRDSSTTGVYYKISNGFTAPLSLEAAQVKKSQQDSKTYTRIEICKSRNHLYSQAKEREKDRPTDSLEL